MSAQGPSILVVDDSATSRLVIEKQLRKFGCRVEGAEDGRSALAALAARKFDLVLLDCYMPDINGYEVARHVRESEGDGADGYTPLIGISAEADAAHVQLCLDSGMDGILGKPLPLEEFKKMLSLWCDFDVDAMAATTVAAPPDIGTVDLEALFRTTSLLDLAAMRSAHQSADVAAVQRLAHRMKGAALTMSRADIVEVLERIEDATHDSRTDAAGIGALIATLEAVLST